VDLFFLIFLFLVVYSYVIYPTTLLFFLKQNGISNKELKDAVNQLMAKTSYFNNHIESTLLSKMKKSDLAKQEEFTYEILEFLEEKLKKRKP
jgi:DNA-binding NarL/FixJ family response regulator